MARRMSILAQHIDDPTSGTRHRCVLLDERHLRCLDCQRTLVLPAPNAAGKTTSTSPSPARLTDPDACPSHPGQRQEACGPCRAEQLEASEARSTPQPTADVTAGAAAARAALAAARQRTTSHEETDQ
jgi:hypothetical protein